MEDTNTMMDSSSTSLLLRPSQTSSSGILQRLAGKKLRSQLSSTFNESASTGCQSSFAKKQLEKMGWTEGTGLGKNRNGMSTHIKVTRRIEEQGGLGCSQQSEAALLVGTHDWWKNSLEDTLSKLSSTGGGKSKKDKKKKRSSKKEKENSTKKRKIYTDEELFAATGGARFGMRAQAPQRAKFQRAEEGGNKDDDDESPSTTKAEWNGLTEPEVLLSSTSSSKNKKKRRKLNSEEEEEGKTTEEDVSDVSEEEAEKLAKKKKKQAKKEKKEKKRLKKEKKQQQQQKE